MKAAATVECRSQVGNFRTARVTTADIVDALVSACLRAVNHARSCPNSLLAACRWPRLRFGKQLVQSQLRSTTPPLQRGYATQTQLAGPDSGRTTPEARRSCSIGSPTNRPQEAHAAILRFATRLDGRTMNGVSVNTTLPSSRILPDTLNTPQPRLGFAHGLTCSAHLPLPATHERIGDAYGHSSKRLRDAAKQHFVLRCACVFHAEGISRSGFGGPRRTRQLALSLEVGSAASKLNAARRSLGARPPRPDRRKLRSPGQGQYPGSSKLAHAQAGTAVGPRPGVAASLSSGTTE